MSEASVDMGLIARQQRQIISDMGALKDDTGVMMAILMRVDGTLSGLVNEVRTLHSQQPRLATRVRVLETTSNEEPL